MVDSEISLVGGHCAFKCRMKGVKAAKLFCIFVMDERLKDMQLPSLMLSAVALKLFVISHHVIHKDVPPPQLSCKSNKNE